MAESNQKYPLKDKYPTMKAFLGDFVKMRRDGFSIARVCNAWGIGYQTYYDWVHKYPEFKAAQQRGETAYHTWVEEKAIEGMGQGHQFNAQVFKILAATKAGFSEKSTDVCRYHPNAKDLKDKTLEKMVLNGDASADFYHTIHSAKSKQFERENGLKILEAEDNIKEMVKSKENE